MNEDDEEDGTFRIGRVEVSPRFGGHDNMSTQWEFSSDDDEVRARMASLPEFWPGRTTGLPYFHLLQGPQDTPEPLARAVALLLDAKFFQPEIFQAVIDTMLEYHRRAMDPDWQTGRFSGMTRIACEET